MIPVLWPDQSRELDGRSPVAVDVLVQRAGYAVAHAALELLGGAYGRRVTIVCGPGNNGADGRVAARVLARRGVRTRVVEATDRAAVATSCTGAAAGDLVIDAAFGTGFRDSFWAPREDRVAPVLAVDIPSGVDAATGAVNGSAWNAAMTVSFACAKPGLLLHPGASMAGRIRIADIGLDASELAGAWWMDEMDLGSWPRRDALAHKWSAAVGVVAGSAGMWGASGLAAAGAVASGAGMVRLIGHDSDAFAPIEAVRVSAADPGEIVAALAKCRAAVVGPGIGRTGSARERLDAVLSWPGPVVVDADGLWHLGAGDAACDLLARRSAPVVLTPHVAEFAQLLGRPLARDVVGDVRSFARAAKCVVLLKGPTTIVADPEGRVWFVTSGDERLATAGTGDVLSGVIAAGIASRRDRGPLAEVVALAAYIHGRAGSSWPSLVSAGQLPGRVAAVLGSEDRVLADD